VSDCILIRQYPCQSGAVLGRISLNNVRAINALTQEMVDVMQLALDDFAQRDDIVAVLIDGEGEKGFCAGGDIRAMYQSAQNNLGGPAVEAEWFFEREYRLNFTMHNYPKPLIAYAHGILMGGGMGLFEPCDYHIVTPSTRIAMPEIAIALYPDVGASYFMPKWPHGSGYFLALTGATINARDALDLNLADCFMPDASQSLLIQELCAALPVSVSHTAVENCLERLSLPFEEAPVPQITPHLALIEDIVNRDNLNDTIEGIAELRNSEDPWLQKAAHLMQAGSPLSIVWTYQQFRRCEGLGLADCLRAEMILSTNTVRHPEFSEGVRALIIDKDKQPKWQFASVEDVSEVYIAAFFEPPWTHNPLHDL